MNFNEIYEQGRYYASNNQANTAYNLVSQYLKNIYKWLWLNRNYVDQLRNMNYGGINNCENIWQVYQIANNANVPQTL
jgi:hypothetical protein